jgi:hypothetical protein
MLNRVFAAAGRKADRIVDDGSIATRRVSIGP